MEREAADSAAGEALGHQVWTGSIWEGSGCSGLPHFRQLGRGWQDALGEVEGLPQPSFWVCGGWHMLSWD